MSFIDNFHPDGRTFKNTKELMNWLVFGDDAKFYGSVSERPNKENF